MTGIQLRSRLTIVDVVNSFGSQELDDGDPIAICAAEFCGTDLLSGRRSWMTGIQLRSDHC